MNSTKIEKALAAETELGLNSNEFFVRLRELVAEMITRDFNGLVNLLYKVDVSEAELKKQLAEHSSEDAAGIIAALLVKRQLQKLNTKDFFSQQTARDSGEERW